MPNPESNVSVNDLGARRTSRWSILAGLVWFFLMTLGLAALNLYSNAPGAVGQASSAWPTDAGLTRGSERFTLLMFVHPRCSCSQASVEQLARIRARCNNQLAIHVLFYCPAEESDAWAQTRLWESVQRIPGAELSLDREGKMATRFGALTSGHVAVFDARGHRVFHGGITAARAHEGDNLGMKTVIDCVRSRVATNGNEVASICTPVFGCGIHPHRHAQEPAQGMAP